jgi:hypothetical protein
MIGAALATGANTALAAAECLTEPNRDPPQGSHWFYRVDRATDRRCWYLRAWTPPPSPAPTAETQRAAARPPAGEAAQRAPAAARRVRPGDATHNGKIDGRRDRATGEAAAQRV